MKQIDRETIIPIELDRPQVTTRQFKNFDAALDFCRFAEPESVIINRLYEGGMGKAPVVVGYSVQYIGSEGML